MTVYGYARVSTSAQDLALQVAELQAAGCDQVVKETASAAPGERRPRLARLVGQLQAGDVVLVTRLDRLARSTRDALNLLASVVEKGAGFRSLREAWADTTTAHGRFMVAVFSGLAEFERELILTRTAEGRAAAMARGVRMGRPGRLTASQVRLILASQAATPPESVAALAAMTGASRSTIYRVIKRGAAAPIARPAQLDIESVIEAAGEAAGEA